jgi:hypothetical protein
MRLHLIDCLQMGGTTLQFVPISRLNEFASDDPIPIWALGLGSVRVALSLRVADCYSVTY